MKVVREAVLERVVLDREEAFGGDGDDVLSVLDAPFDDQRGMAENHRAPAFEDVGADDGVGEAGLVLESDEDEALGGSGALAHDYHAADADSLAVALAGEVGGGGDTLPFQLRPEERHRMRTGGHPRAAEVRGQLFPL